jgi:hypothetical protein
LLDEASLYRYADDDSQRGSEAPLDEHNHALAALRYLISRLDARRMARMRHGPSAAGPAEGDTDAPAAPSPAQRRWLRLDNEALWTPL